MNIIAKAWPFLAIAPIVGGCEIASLPLQERDSPLSYLELEVENLALRLRIAELEAELHKNP